MAEIASCHPVAEFHGCYSDQQIGERKAHALGLALTVDRPDADSNWYRDRVNGHGCEYFMDELLPLCFALWCVGASRAVGQFDECNNRQGDLSFSRSSGDCGQHLPRVPSLPLGSDQNTGIED